MLFTLQHVLKVPVCQYRLLTIAIIHASINPLIGRSDFNKRHFSGDQKALFTMEFVEIY